MTEIEIIKELFKAHASHSNIVVELENLEKYVGKVTFFDGERVTIDDNELMVSLIKKVEECCIEESDMPLNIGENGVLNDFEKLLLKRVSVKSTQYKEELIEGLLYSICTEQIVVVSSSKKWVLERNSVLDISEANAGEVFERNTKDELNPFEMAIIDADKERVLELVNNTEEMISFGYSLADISNMLKTVNAPLPWNDDEKNRVYNQGRRIYEVEGNRGNIAYSLFAKYLSADISVFNLRCKSVSSILDIVDSYSASDLVAICNEYRDVIEQRDYLCNKAATLLVAKGQVDFARELANGGVFEEKTLLLEPTDTRVSYKEILNSFLVPNKYACNQLLSQYANQDRQEEFFSIVDTQLPDIREDMSTIENLRKVFKSCDGQLLNKYLLYFPLLWQDTDIASRYVELNSERSFETAVEQRMLNQCVFTMKYGKTNELEDALIRSDFNSFEVLRSNNSVLLSYGYNVKEIENIRDIDTSSIKKMTSTGRLLLLEGNRNHVAESMAWKDFLRNPKTLCAELFPLLLQEKNAALIYEFYNYSERIREQLIQVKPLYITSLMILDYKDEFWSQVKDEWISLDLSPEVLSYAIDIAVERNEQQASAMIAYSNMSKLNDFEMALIGGNAAKLRAIVSDAKNLTEMGYSAEEIGLIIESTRHRIDFKSDDKLSIANRVFAFQKNKNSVAEFYYKMALLDGDTFAAYGLFSVYENESRFEELCEIFETHLVKNEEKITAQMRGSYLLSLFERKKFDEFAEYYVKHKDEAVVNPVIVLEVLLSKKTNDPEIERIIAGLNNASKEDALALKHCIQICLQAADSQENIKRAVTLFNIAFSQLGENEVIEIAQCFEKVDMSIIPQPMGNGILTLVTKKVSFLKDWCEYLRVNSQSENEYVQKLEKVDLYIGNNVLGVSDIVRKIVCSLYQSNAFIPETLERYLIPEMNSDTEIRNWLDECLCNPAELDDIKYKSFCDFSEKLGEQERIVEIICCLARRKSCKVTGLKETILTYISGSTKKNDSETTAVLLDALLHLAGNYQLTQADVFVLYKAYMLIANYEYAFIADKAIGNIEVLSDEEKQQVLEFRRELDKNKETSLFSVISKEAQSIKDCHLVETLLMWKGLFRVTEEDTAASEELRDYFNSPEKWSDQAKDLVVKQLLCNVKYELYWQLLKQYYSDSDEAIKLNIEYQYSKIKPELLKSVIFTAQKQGLKEQLIDIINYILSDEKTAIFDKCYEQIYRTIGVCPGIYSSTEIALMYINNLFENEDLCKNDKALRFVLEVSEQGGCVTDFAERYTSSVDVIDYLFLQKVLCKVLLTNDNATSITKRIIEVLKNAPHEVAYQEMLIDICTSLTLDQDVRQELLNVIYENDLVTVDEQLIYRQYIKAIVNGCQSAFMMAVEIIKKYYLELSVYDDLKKYELTSKAVEDDKVLEIYEDEYSQMTSILAPDRLLKTIINMLPGDIFLSQKNFAHNSAYEYGLKYLSANELETLKINYELFNSVCVAFDQDPEFLSIFMKACFLRQWEEVVLYKAADKYINDIIRNDFSIKKVLVKRHFEVLKWVFLSMLDANVDDEDVVDRAYILLSATGIVRFNKNTLRRFYKMDDYYRSIVRRIFSIRIESVTLRRLGYVGEAILEIIDNEKVAYLICTLSPSDLSTIFNNENCFEALMSMPIDRAQKIAEIYLGLFSEGKGNVFSRVVGALQSNTTIFSALNNSGEEDEALSYSRKRFRKQLDTIGRAGDSAPKNLQKNFEIAKAEYLFYSVLADEKESCSEINPTEMDYVSVLTMLFNRKSIKDIKEFIWKLSKEMLLPVYAYLLQLGEQYALAYRVTEFIQDDKWKTTLYQVQYRAMKWGSLKPEEKEIQKNIRERIEIDGSYWMGKSYPINEEQVSEYANKMEELKDLLYEYKDYLLFNGLNVVDINLDEEKIEDDLGQIKKRFAKKIEVNDINDYLEEESSECVANYLDNKLLEDMIGNMNVVPIKDLDHAPQTLEECVGAIAYYATVKRDSKNRRDILTAKNLARWAFLKKMDATGYSRKLLLEVLKLIGKDDAINKSQWIVIVSYLVKYFEEIENLSRMSRMLENDLPLIKALANEDGSTLRLFGRVNLRVWRNIEIALSEISGVDYQRLNEAEQMQRLSSIRSNLLANASEKQTSSFLQINNKILRLINEKITGLKNSAELLVTVLEENKNQEVSIVWEPSNDTGYLYAIISNNGGNSCENVTLSSKINDSKEKSYEIDRIYSGEKIPFRENFKKSDLIDDQVSWDIEVKYNDPQKEMQEVVLHHVMATVTYSNESLNLGNISTGNPAKGKNFVGRVRELALLRNRYSDEEQLPSMLIRGLKRSGKSSILIQLMESLKDNNQFVVVFVDGQSIGDDIKNAFVDKVIDGIRIGYRNVGEYKELIENGLNDFKMKWQDAMKTTDWIGQLDWFYYELSQLLGKKILVIIDEMESIFYNHRFESNLQEEMLYASLRALIQKAENYVSFIFCGSDTLLTSCLEQRSETQMFQTLQYLEVGHMNHGDIQEIFKRQSEKYEITFTSDAVETIWEYSDGMVWYAKLLGYLVINNILANDLTIRSEVNRWDILQAVQMLINGEIGTDKYDLVDACLNTPRTAIIHAMASVMPDRNKEVSVDEIFIAVKMMKVEGYINPRNGEEIPELNVDLVKEHLDFLEKMQFVKSNASRTKYEFTAELYRLFFRTDKKLHLFEERRIQ